MPILWRYALHEYTKNFFLSTFTFISILIVARFKEIARFGALSGDLAHTGLFIVYQIPAILPMAIPISSLLAATILFHKWSTGGELTAMRTNGFSLSAIVTPILALSLLISLLHFSISAELAPYCRRQSKNFLYAKTSTNPLLLLQRQTLAHFKHAYVDMDVTNNETIKNVLIISPFHGKRLHLLTAQKLQFSEETLSGEDVTLVNYLDNALIIENQASMQLPGTVLSEAMKRKSPHLDMNAHSFKMLRIKKTSAASTEIQKRLLLPLCTFSFTLLGVCFR